jgi:hypothetical protein
VPFITGGGGGGGGGAGGTLLFSSTLGAPAATIDTGAAGIAGTSNILDVYIIARTTDAGSVGALLNVVVNGDSGAHYDFQTVSGNNTTISASEQLAGTKWTFIGHGTGGGASFASMIHLTFPFYAATTFFKVGHSSENTNDSLTTTDNWLQEHALTFRSTAAISQIAVNANTGGQNLVAGSSMFIYGR